MHIAALLALVFLTVSPAVAVELHPCFTPGRQNCTAFIVSAIEAAQSRLLVQAYGFTSCPIIKAIGEAKTRGVNVKVLLDHSNEKSRAAAPGIAYLRGLGIEPLIDYRVTIAHNKVLIIDHAQIITGSFNFTASAQSRNAENVLDVRNDPVTAKLYADNWERRKAVSRPMAPMDLPPAATLDCPPPRNPDRLRQPRRGPNDLQPKNQQNHARCWNDLSDGFSGLLLVCGTDRQRS